MGSHGCRRRARGGLAGLRTQRLILVPIAFNAFFELGRGFDYPNILRKEPDEILRRFVAGGPGLILRWEALLVSALLMLPLAALLAVVLGASPALSVLSVVVGATAAVVQGLRLARWPFAVCSRTIMPSEGRVSGGSRVVSHDLDRTRS
jgi:hypothetical protein